MIHEHATDETKEHAALYALGALDSAETDTFERHLQEGCSSCQAELEAFRSVVGHLGFNANVENPPDTLRAKILAAVAEHAQPSPTDSLSETFRATAQSLVSVLVRAAEGIWQEVMPGLQAKFLFSDAATGRTTALVRMSPGVQYPPHRHIAPEEFYVLEGGCIIDGKELLPGDYLRAPTGSIHTQTTTNDGCLVLVIVSLENEVLDAVTE